MDIIKNDIILIIIKCNNYKRNKYNYKDIIY
jgi:hypothetical protein